ncbi:MAG: FAD:protein FMN transferase [Lachnospiraceae bacterium]|nr:FAD:protein FMN transferase [Lachnospiraceae bacterium]
MIRKNIKYYALVALVILTVGIALCLRFLSGTESTYETSFFAMDTYMSVKGTGRDAQGAVEAVRDAIIGLDGDLSVTNPESLVYELNAQGTCTADSDMEYLIEKSLSASDLTDGAFNICIYPIMKEWGFTTGEFKVPEASALSALCDELASSEVTLNKQDKSVRLSEGTMIDFGGIAKGYATKVAVDIMNSKRISSALINLGGNVYALGKKPDGSLWNVAVKSPVDSIKYLGVLSVSDKAVITSGGYERYFEEGGITYHHIIDPSTGYPADSGAQSVTVVSSDPTLADALSTAIFVMGEDKATALWRDNSELFDFIYFDASANLFITEGIKDEFSSEIDFKIIEK